MVDYTDPVLRAKAKNRAIKLLQELFKPANFAPIMMAVEANDGTAFNDACETAGLSTEETQWLKNYLDNCSTTLWSNTKVRDDPLFAAASSGW